MEDMNTHSGRFFLLLKLNAVVTNSSPGKFSHMQVKRVAIIAMLYEERESIFVMLQYALLEKFVATLPYNKST